MQNLDVYPSLAIRKIRVLPDGGPPDTTALTQTVGLAIKSPPFLSAVANVFPHASHISPEYRHAFFGHRPSTLWLTGLSGAGKSTIAYALERLLLEKGQACCVLDGDNMRNHLCSDLGFTDRDRKENIRRTAEVARLMNDAGMLVITALISPYRDDRAMARALIGADKFVEVHVSTSCEVCEARDPKGLYAKARAGKIPGFTGVSSPYESPLSANIMIDTGKLPLEESTAILFKHLASDFFRPTVT